MSIRVKLEHKQQPVWIEELPSEVRAWDVCQKLADWPHLLFLDSESSALALAGARAEGCRYSFVAADPFLWITSKNRHVVVGDEIVAGDPFEVLRGKLSEFPQATLPNLPPFQGGAAGLFGYDLCHHLEELPRPAFDDFAVPELAVGLYDWAASFDHATGRGWLIATGYPEKDPGKRRRRAQDRLDQVKERLARPAPATSWSPQAPMPLTAPHFPCAAPNLNLPQAGPGRATLLSNMSRELYLKAARRAIDYVHAGDCFQVNIAQQLLMPATLPPLALYERLRQRNPAPFAGYFDMGEFVLASASPERFLRLSQGVVETRPIKGTRPRGSTPALDQAIALQLQASAKDRAENVMIVDLLRNDLGRVCRFGSVRVEALCRLESYAFVHHLVSDIRGRLRDGLGAIDLLRATFPGGSVTGAPKIRAMQIITELEQVARGPYCGSLGYIGFDGTMDTNLLIRTFTIGKGWMQFPVGGGIVADSDPDNEYDETWHKARGMLAVCEDLS